jgi:hypothetical protein
MFLLCFQLWRDPVLSRGRRKLIQRLGEPVPSSPVLRLIYQAEQAAA